MGMGLASSLNSFYGCIQIIEFTGRGVNHNLRRGQAMAGISGSESW